MQSYMFITSCMFSQLSEMCKPTCSLQPPWLLDRSEYLFRIPVLPIVLEYQGVICKGYHDKMINPKGDTYLQAYIIPGMI